MAKAIVTEEDGPHSHAAIVGLTLDVPVIVGAKYATKVLKNGTVVTVDAELGFVSSHSFDQLVSDDKKKNKKD